MFLQFLFLKSSAVTFALSSGSSHFAQWFLGTKRIRFDRLSVIGMQLYGISFTDELVKLGGAYNTCNLWILLRKIVIYLVGGKFLSSCTFFFLLKLTEVTSIQDPVS